MEQNKKDKELSLMKKQQSISVNHAPADFSHTKTLVQLSKELGVEKIYSGVAAQLSNFLNYIGCEWNNAQKQDVVELICNNYANLTAEQWKLFYVKAKTGTFGDIYGKLSPIAFMKWVNTYAAECDYANEQFKIQKDRQINEVSEEIPVIDGYFDKLIECINQVANKPETDNKSQRIAEKRAEWEANFKNYFNK
jgi:hypothetical protein